jgi:hypothetical protein
VDEYILDPSTNHEFGHPPELVMSPLTSPSGASIHTTTESGVTTYYFAFPTGTDTSVASAAGSIRVRVTPKFNSIKLSSVTFPTPPSGWKASVTVDRLPPYETVYSWSVGAHAWAPPMATATNTTGDSQVTPLNVYLN